MRRQNLLSPSRLTTKKQGTSGFTDEVARDVVKKFRVLFGTAKQHYRQVEARCGLGGAQLWALTEVARTPGINVREIAAAMLVHQSTASNLVDRIETLGLISKRRAKEDKRVVRLFVTVKGRNVLSRAPEPTVGVLPDALQQLPANVLESLNANMGLLIAKMSRKNSSAAAKTLADL